MKIETIKLNDPDTNETTIKLIDRDTSHEYRRILSGLGWPYSNKPGFVVVVGEDYDQDHSIEYSPRHYRVLSEHESKELESLYRHCLKFMQEYLLENILGDIANPFFDLFRKLGGKVAILPPTGFDKITLGYIGQLIKRNTSATRKTLHFGKSKLPGHLRSFTDVKIEREQLDQNPATAALGFVLSELEKTKPAKIIFQVPQTRLSGPDSWMAG